MIGEDSMICGLDMIKSMDEGLNNDQAERHVPNDDMF